MPDFAKTLDELLRDILPEFPSPSLPHDLAKTFVATASSVESVGTLKRNLPPRSARALLSALLKCPDPLAAIDCAAELAQNHPAGLIELTPPRAQQLAAFLSGGPFLRERIRKHPEWLPWLFQHADKLFSSEQLSAPVAGPCGTEPGWEALRVWHDKHLLRIAFADCADLLDITDTAQQLSILAGTTIEAVAKQHEHALNRRYGQPRQEDGSAIEWCAIGLGKLGGNELNFRSDVDLMFVYSADGVSSGASSPPVSALEWFNRWAEAVVGTLTEVSAEGLLYRVDTRLRPDGQSGALARSAASYGHYYEQRGEVWERQMLIKARPVAGSNALGETLLSFLEAFVYPRSLTTSPREEIHRIKNRIIQHLNERVSERDADGADRNLKLRRGGLRDIEFIVQCLQMVVGGSDRTVREYNTLEAIRKLAERGVFSEVEGRELDTAYRMLRRIEHRMQMATGQPSFVLPAAEDDLATLARRNGYRDANSFLADLEKNRGTVISIYDTVLGPPEALAEVGVLLSLPPGDPAACSQLAEFGFVSPGDAHRNLLHLSSDDSALPSAVSTPMQRLLPKLLEELRTSANPDRGLNNVERMLRAFGAVTSFADLLSSHHALLNLLVTVGSRSETLTETIVRDPGLVDWMLYSGALLADRNPEDIDLESRATVAGQRSEERKLAAIHSFRRKENLRIGMRFLLGLSEEETTSQHLTALADAITKRVIRLVLDRLGESRNGSDPLSWAIIGLGKLGGFEMNFGSDLDLFFAYETGQESDESAAYITALAQGVLKLLSDNTEHGLLYEVDARLRPEGKHGPLALSLEGYRHYLRNRAAQWELQALTNARVIAANPGFEKQVEETIRDALRVVSPAQLAAEALSMRLRMQEQAEKDYGTRQNIKTGFGGLVDGEFVVQVGKMLLAGHHPEILAHPTRSALRKMATLGLLTGEVSDSLRDSYEALKRIQMHLRVNDDRAHNVLPGDDNALRALAKGLGFSTPDHLLNHVRKVTAEMRRSFLCALKELGEIGVQESRRPLV